MSDRLKDLAESLRGSIVFWSMIGSLLLIGLAIIYQPNTPSLLEESHSKTTQECTQSRHSPADPDSNVASSVTELYTWSCDPKASPQYQENKDKNPARSSTDADLLAQERVAYWTRIIAALTALGIGILGWTLYETRAVGTVARDIGQRQIRAYLSIPEASIKTSEQGLTVSGVIKNSGQSPAMRVEVWFDCRWTQGERGQVTSYKVRIEDVPVGDDGKPFSVDINVLRGADSLIQVDKSFGLDRLTVYCEGIDVFETAISANQRFETKGSGPLGLKNLVKLVVHTGTMRVPVGDMRDR